MSVSWRVQALIRFLQVVLSFARCLQESTKMFFRFRFLFTSLNKVLCYVMSLNLSLGRPWFLFPSRNWQNNSCLASPVKFVAIMEIELAVSVKVRVRVRSPGSSPGVNLMLVYLLWTSSVALDQHVISRVFLVGLFRSTVNKDFDFFFRGKLLLLLSKFPHCLHTLSTFSILGFHITSPFKPRNYRFF